MLIALYHGVFFQGSKDQFQEVWEKEDHLEDQDFDPKTFFMMHGQSSGGQHAGCSRVTALGEGLTCPAAFVGRVGVGVAVFCLRLVRLGT